MSGVLILPFNLMLSNVKKKYIRKIRVSGFSVIRRRLHILFVIYIKWQKKYILPRTVYTILYSKKCILMHTFWDKWDIVKYFWNHCCNLNVSILYFYYCFVV